MKFSLLFETGSRRQYGYRREQKFDQLLDQLSHSMTRLTNMLVCHVTDRLPQLYLRTKLHLLSSIGGLSKAVLKVQQAWNELTFFIGSEREKEK